jgi:5-keto-L-gluconate epimerase
MTRIPKHFDWKLGWACPPLDEIPLEQGEGWLDKLAEYGYQGIEPLIGAPFEVPSEKWLSLLEKSDLTLIGLRTGGIVQKKGLTLSDPDPSIRSQAVSSLIEVIEYGTEFGAPKILIGLIQGQLKPSVTLTDALGWIRDGLERCALTASRLGMKIGLEPINHHELGYNNTTGKILSLVQKINSPNLGLLLDTFHMDQEEQDFHTEVQKATGWISHIHLADRRRLPPGQDGINFDAYLKAFQLVGYQGFLSVECIERPDPLTAAQGAANFLLPQFAAILNYA